MTNKTVSILCTSIGKVIPAIVPMVTGKGPPAILQGAVDRDDNDSLKRGPITGVQVIAEAEDQSSSQPVKTDTDGHFIIR